MWCSELIGTHFSKENDSADWKVSEGFILQL